MAKGLTDVALRNAKPKDAVYFLVDGDGLRLKVAPTGAKVWQYRYRHDGKGQIATLGRYPDLSLTEARDAAREARRKVEAGDHLTTVKRATKEAKMADNACTFMVLIEGWLVAEARNRRWSPKHVQTIRQSLLTYLPSLLDVPAKSITPLMVHKDLEKIKSPTMDRLLRRRVRSILNWAWGAGLLPGNPLPPAQRGAKLEHKHFSAVLSVKDVGDVLRESERVEQATGVRRACLLIAFTAQRIGNVITALWTEFDLDAGTWTIPRSKMKKKSESLGPHVVPLTPRLLAMLREWKRIDGDNPCVCPSPYSQHSKRKMMPYVSHNTVEHFYRDKVSSAGRHTAHGWRTVFRTWCSDAGKNTEDVEAQMDHTIGSEVRAAYDRSNRLALRRELMTWYEGRLWDAWHPMVLTLRSAA